jgi:signal transduction histidine kinase
MSWFLLGLLAGAAGGVVVLLVLSARWRRRQADLAWRADQAEATAHSLRRLADLGRITGALAHEIKNPLSTIGLNLRLLEEDLGPAEDRLRNRLAVVQRETARLRDILDDFLRYAGKLELDRRPTNLNSLLEELVDFFAPQAQIQQVQLRLRPPGASSPIIADIDPKTIKQAVLNLMINAVQAMTSGGELILSAAVGQNGQAVIDVIDTGPGIPPESLDKIFQADYSTKKGGTGLGLPMARRIAEEHGGSLTVRSELGKGSDFSLAVPLAATPSPSINAPAHYG